MKMCVKYQAKSLNLYFRQRNEASKGRGSQSRDIDSMHQLWRDVHRLHWATWLPFV